MDDVNRILDVLREIRELEQFRGLHRDRIPVVIFRPRDRPADLARLLEQWVTEFRGNLPWRLRYSGPGINWVLAPQRLWDFAAERGVGGRPAEAMLSRGEPDLVERAHDDLRGLAEYLSARWRAHRGNAT
jgi:hypothetical protein